MKNHVRNLLMLVIGFTFGCNKQVEVNGEVFAEVTRSAKELFQPSTQSIEPHPGTVIYILTESANEAFSKQLHMRSERIKAQSEKDWKDYEEKQFSMLSDITNRVVDLEKKRLGRSKEGKPNSLIEIHRKEFPNKSHTDKEILENYAEKHMDILEGYPDALMDYLESKDEKLRTFKGRMDYEISKAGKLVTPYREKALDFNVDEIKRELLTAINVVADSGGKFKVNLHYGRTYYVAAESGLPFSKAMWHFKFKPEGQKLVLSDGNKIPAWE